MRTIVHPYIQKIAHYGKVFPMVFSCIVVLAFLLVPASKKIESANFRTLTLKYDEAQASVSFKEGFELISIDKVPSIKKKSSKNIDDHSLETNRLKNFKPYFVAPRPSFKLIHFYGNIFADNFSLSAQPTTYSDGESHSLSTTISRFILYKNIKAFVA